VVTVLGSRLFGRSVGIIAGLLLAGNAFLVHYAQEVRGYTLALLLVAVSTLLFVRLVESGSTAVWVSYVAVGALSLYAHFFAALVIAAHGVSVVAVPDRRARRSALSAIALVAVLGAPLALFVLTRDAGQVDLVPRASPYRIVAAFGALSGGTVPMLALFGLASVLAVSTLWRTRHTLQEQEKWRYALILSWLIVPVAGSLLINLVKPFFMARYLLVVLPPLVILVALGVHSLRSRVAVVAATVLLILGSLHALAGWYEGEEKEGLNFRRAAERILTDGRPTDGIVFYRPSRRLPIEYYLRRRAALADAPEPLYPRSGWGRFDLISDYESRRPAGESWAELAERAGAAHARVWLVKSGSEFARDELRMLESALERQYDVRATWDYGLLEVVLYAR
jgi:mannosyltransferase